MPFVSGDKVTGARVSFAIGAASARNGSDLANGSYLITTDTNCYIKQGDSTVTASATDASMFLPAGGGVTLTVDGTAAARIAAIQQSAAGRLFIQKLDPAVL